MLRLPKSKLVVLLLGFASAACARLSADPPGPVSTATLVDGPSFAARFVAVTEDGRLRFDRSGEPVHLRFDELVVWGTFRDREHGTQILLVDGSLLVADVLAIESDVVVVAGRFWAEAKIPRTLILAIVFRPPLDTLARDRLFDRASEKGRQDDRLILENGDELSGRLTLPVRPDPGAFNPTRIRWPVRGRTKPLDVPLKRVVAIMFPSESAADPAPPTAHLVGFRDGSCLYVRDMTRVGNALKITLHEGLVLVTEPGSSPAANPWNPVVMLRPSNRQLTYLSDLEPLGYRHIAYLDSSWPYQVDRSVSGGKLRLAGQVVAKGIGMHSSSRLAFETENRYRWFQAELAIDERAGRQGSVTFRVYTQGAAGTWTMVYESDTLRGGQPAVPIRVDIANAVRLALIVDFADRADQWDHANWLNARLIR